MRLPGVRMLSFFDGDVADGESAYLLAIREKVCLSPVCLSVCLSPASLFSDSVSTHFLTPHTLTASH